MSGAPIIHRESVRIEGRLVERGDELTVRLPGRKTATRVRFLYADEQVATVTVADSHGGGSRTVSVDAGAQVVVDFTHVDAARENLRFLAANGIHAVVGTSGFTEAEHDEIASWFTTSNCLIAPNFAVGAVLMIRFAEMAAPFFDTAEVIELHHDGKIDAPSGTAIGTAERMARASADWAPPDWTTTSRLVPTVATTRIVICYLAWPWSGLVITVTTPCMWTVRSLLATPITTLAARATQAFPLWL